MSGRLAARVATLEALRNKAPMLTLQVQDQPTPEQLETMEHAKRTGRQLIVFYSPGDTAWFMGDGPPPWESPD